MKIKISKKPIAFFPIFLFLASSALAEGWSIDNYGTDITGLPGGTIEDIVSNVAMWLLGIFGFIGVIGFVIAGIFYLTAAGDAEQEKKAKKAMTMSIAGVVVGLLGLVILKAADSLLNASW
jgi:riboflavin transporter FmnP